VPARKAALRILAPDAIIRPGRRGPDPSPVSERVVLWPDAHRPGPGPVLVQPVQP
jgi:hypothetical protein